jgi:hypothetical protein
LSEAEKFFEKFESDEQNKIDNLYIKIEKQAEERGCLEHLVAYERGSIFKFKEDDLRLYFIRFGNSVVILGSGDYKRVRATQDSEVLMDCVKALEEIEFLINKRIIQDKELYVTENRLVGNLKFEIE